MLSDGFYCLLAPKAARFFREYKFWVMDFTVCWRGQNFFREYKFWVMDFRSLLTPTLETLEPRTQVRVLSKHEFWFCGPKCALVVRRYDWKIRRRKSFPRLQYFCFGAGNSRKWVEWGGFAGREAPRKKSDFWISNLSKNKQKYWVFVQFRVFYTIWLYSFPPLPWLVAEPECEEERKS